MSDPEAPQNEPVAAPPSPELPPDLAAAPGERPMPAAEPPSVSPADPVMGEVLARQRDKWIGMAIVGVTFLIGIAISLWAKHASRPETSAPPGPPTTEGIVGWPSHVDATATLIGARKVTRRKIFRGLVAQGVSSDGKVDLTEGSGQVRYAFQSAPGQGPQPDSEVGPLPQRQFCGRQDVLLRKEGLVADNDQASAPCPPKQPEPLPDPQCSLATIWQRAIERGFRTDRLAHIEYYRAHGGPAWRFEQPETGARFVLYGDCRTELKGGAASGRVP
ncbi:MAG TPA: hypothetical protein VMI54_01050 [Polyangiaceae bacterium]|nr:hypothetical protein [Polyangiaceae bacterium]